jgi:hypothetical protein
MLWDEYSSNRTPSNRASLGGVAIHKYPSGDCTMLAALLFGNPSSDCQVRTDHNSAPETVMENKKAVPT